METLIDFINDNMIDDFEFPYSKIHKMDDEQFWNLLSEKFGAFEILKTAKTSSNFNLEDKYFLFLDEPKHELRSFSEIWDLVYSVGGADVIESACENAEKIVIAGYGKTEIWDSREAAKQKYFNGVIPREGLKEAIYSEIYSALCVGNWFILNI